MKPSVKRLLNLLFILGMLGLLIYIAFGSNELVNAWDVLMSISFRWVLACFGCIAAHVLFDALSTHSFLKTQNAPITFLHAVSVSITGYFYSNITPGSSGGQPIQIYELRKQNVPVGISTSALCVKFIFIQLSIILPCTVLWILNKDFVAGQIGAMGPFLILGLILTASAILLLLLLLINKSLVRRFTLWLLRIGVKLHIVKNPDSASQKLTDMIETFHGSIQALLRHPWEIGRQMIYSTLQMLSLMLVVLCVYHAFGLWEVPWHRLLTLAYLIFISASYIPLPGGSGAQEGGFLTFFAGLYPAGQATLALLTWRFFGYYLILLVGITVNLVRSMKSSRSRKRGDA